MWRVGSGLRLDRVGSGCSASVVPGTGAVLAEDLGDVRNPCLIWGAISDPYLYRMRITGGERTPTSSAARGTATRTSPSGPARRAATTGATSRAPACSRSTTPATATTRPGRRREKWSTDDNPMSFGPGTYAFYLSFRLQELPDGSSPFPHPQVEGGGIAEFSQLVQWKSFGGEGSNLVALYATIGSDGIKFVPIRGRPGPARRGSSACPPESGSASRWSRTGPPTAGTRSGPTSTATGR